MPSNSLYGWYLRPAPLVVLPRRMAGRDKKKLPAFRIEECGELGYIMLS